MVIKTQHIKTCDWLTTSMLKEEFKVLNKTENQKRSEMKF